MEPLCERIVKEHGVRATRAQKQRFREVLMQGLKEAGYAPSVSMDRLLLNNANVVVGDIATARYVLTAHYDTPRRMLLPANVIFPRSMALSVLYQLFWFLVPVAGSALLARLAALLFPGLGFWQYEFALLAFWALSIFLFFGLENKHNANDNTSGVVALTQTLLALPPALRKHVAAVYFDNEEWGLLGSAAFARQHGKRLRATPVINMDCVGDGDTICFVLGKQLSRDRAFAQKLEGAFPPVSGKDIRAVRGRGWYYPSDHLNFRLGAGVAAFGRMPVLGLYLNRIHTSRDTHLDEGNIALIAQTLTALIAQEGRSHD